MQPVMERSPLTSGRSATPADINRYGWPTSIGTGGRHQIGMPGRHHRNAQSRRRTRAFDLLVARIWRFLVVGARRPAHPLSLYGDRVAKAWLFCLGHRDCSDGRRGIRCQGLGTALFYIQNEPLPPRISRQKLRYDDIDRIWSPNHGIASPTILCERQSRKPSRIGSVFMTTTDRLGDTP